MLTVFAGVPAVTLPLGRWDRMTGAASSHERQLERIAEDIEAMRVLGVKAARWDELEAQYRIGKAGIDGLADLLAGAMSDAAELWLPAGVGGHVDHVAARDAGLRAVQANRGARVVLYADFPYVTEHGWPAWLTGGPAEPFLDAAGWLDDELAARDLDAARLEPLVARLDRAESAHKRRIIETYASQLPGLRLGKAQLDCDPTLLAFELAWEYRWR